MLHHLHLHSLNTLHKLCKQQKDSDF